jgi:hypothetical protein
MTDMLLFIDRFGRQWMRVTQGDSYKYKLLTHPQEPAVSSLVKMAMFDRLPDIADRESWLCGRQGSREQEKA